MDKRRLTAVLGGVFLAATGLNAHAAPNSITDKGSVAQQTSITDNNSVRPEKIEIRNLQGGKLVQNGSRVSLQGGTIIGKAGDSQPLIQIENPRNKQITIRDTRIITDGVTQKLDTDNAGIVVVENSKNRRGAKSRVHIENVHVVSRNNNIQATATATDGSTACAGVVCTSLDEDDKSDIKVKVKGRNKFKAVAK